MDTVEKELKTKKVKKVAKVAKPEVEVKTTKKSAKPEVAKKVEKKVGKKYGPRPKSTSGNYKSARNLIESMFAKNKDASSDEIMKAMKREFPSHRYCVSNHYPWYKTHIVSRNEWTTIDPPAWTKKPTAKIK